MCIVCALALVSQGVVQNLKPYDTVKLMRLSKSRRLVRMASRWSARTAANNGHRDRSDRGTRAGCFARGDQDAPATNGGGFWRQQRSSLRESHTTDNFLTMLSIFAIPAGLTYTLGEYRIAAPRLGRVGGKAILFIADHHRLLGRGQGQSSAARVDQRGNRVAARGNMEGKEVRFWHANSALFAPSPPTRAVAPSWPARSFTRWEEWFRCKQSCSAETVFGALRRLGFTCILIYVCLPVFIAD